MSNSEHWLPVVGYEGYYEVSDQGRVRKMRDDNGKPCPPAVMKLRYNPEPKQVRYLCIRLSRRGIRRSLNVHTLVLTAFVGSRPKRKEAAHWDGDVCNARLSNLRWATPAENTEDKKRHGTVIKGEQSPNAKLRASDVAAIKKRLAAREVGSAIACDFGVCAGTVYAINKGKVWKHVILEG